MSEQEQKEQKEADPSERKLDWTAAVCERCWFDTPGWGWPDGETFESAEIRLPNRINLYRGVVAAFIQDIDAHGVPLQEAMQPLRESVGANPVNVEKCTMCGGATLAGIFVRLDPAEQKYPREKDD